MFDWSSTKGLLLMAGTALSIMLAIGIGIGYVIFYPSATEASSRLETSIERISRLESSIAMKDSRFNDLLNAGGGYRQEIALMKATNDAHLEQLDLQSLAAAAAEVTQKEAATDLVAIRKQITLLEAELSAMNALNGHLFNLEEAIEPMDSDRLLLVELRKSMPDDLDAATQYWKQVKDQAVKSDPSLGTKVDRVIRFLPTYFDWLSGEYTDTCDSVLAFFDSGAVEFGTMSGDLQNDIFLVMINRMDSAINLIRN